MADQRQILPPYFDDATLYYTFAPYGREVTDNDALLLTKVITPPSLFGCAEANLFSDETCAGPGKVRLVSHSNTLTLPSCSRVASTRSGMESCPVQFAFPAASENSDARNRVGVRVKDVNLIGNSD
jgi:hypothetical protein